jgi:hypothetical protein
MQVLFWKMSQLSLLFAQRGNAYERGQAVGRVLGMFFAIVIIYWVYKKFSGGK